MSEIQQPSSNIERVSVADIPVQAFNSLEQAANEIIADDGRVLHEVAVAINPEKVMMARRDDSIKRVILSAQFRYADGIGVTKVMEKKLGKKLQRIPGCDLWQVLMKRAVKTATPVYILGASQQINENTRQALLDMGVNVVGSHSGFFSDPQIIIDDIAASKAKVVTVAMGSPKQEAFIARCREQVPNAFYMGVGGTYDVFTGNVKRAPEIWCNWGLEWFYRLICQPSRLKRQLKLIPFVLLALTNKL